MSRICFEFVPEKLFNAIAYFASRGVTKLDKLKTCKLLFYADKHHLLEHGRPILGDVYFCMPHGPVPSYSKNVIDDTLDGSDPAKPILNYVRVEQRTGHSYPQFVAVREPDLGQFSASELESLDYTCQRYGEVDPWPLRNMSHAERSWIVAHASKPDGVLSVPMPYELFFEGESAETKALLDLIVEEQENRDFAKALAK